MKKTLFAIMALAAMVACSKDETLGTAKYPITFGNAFVENSTRVIDSPNDLKAFKVYGTVQGLFGTANDGSVVKIFDGSDVTRPATGDIWLCGETQYWIPDTKYNFAAIADDNVAGAEDTTPADDAVIGYDANDMPSTITYTTSTQKDLLYAVQTRNIEANADTFNQGPVEFTFSHLLSKVSFTFTNNFSAESGVVLNVTAIKITNAPASGVCTLNGNPASAEWNIAAPTTTTELSFGDSGEIASGGNTGTSGNVGLIVPGTYDGESGKPAKLQVTFTITHNKGGQPTDKTLTVPATTFLAGHSYNLTAELTAANVEGVVPITFNITTNNDWGESTDNNVDIPNNGTSTPNN